MLNHVLSSIVVLELAGLAPAPFCGMMLQDLGADVIRVPSWFVLSFSMSESYRSTEQDRVRTLIFWLGENGPCP